MRQMDGLSPRLSSRWPQKRWLRNIRRKQVPTLALHAAFKENAMSLLPALPRSARQCEAVDIIAPWLSHLEGLATLSGLRSRS
ncbi:hypothetical protein NKR23_g11143 [Pleurostoma richardsiae]|uniref:Uncharacterized protein n=1 Tax=Pleurostoma richardsiae TaxID=41990 RepID=A0AA38R406_9PEZI|nr:hypothetical protein NKR23_g11143 [Pleurostoma richardsiae]